MKQRLFCWGHQKIAFLTAAVEDIAFGGKAADAKQRDAAKDFRFRV